MKFDTHGNGNGLNDLYVLPESNDELRDIIKFLESIGQTFQMSYVNVKGHEWYGKSFLDIPFRQDLKTVIIESLEV